MAIKRSLWHTETELPRFPALEGDCHTDVLIIGGGLAGLLCAFQLRRAGRDCLVVEADRICGGVTGNTTAKITAQHGLIYDKLIKWMGKRNAAEYLQANRKALEEYRALSQKIDCGFVESSAFVYTLDAPQKLQREQKALGAIGCSALWHESTELPFPVAGALEMPGQAYFQPLEFIRGILPGLNIRENTPARRVDDTVVYTDRGVIRAKKVVFCTHFPFIDRRGCYFMKMYQDRSYVLALEGAGPIRGMYIDGSGHGLSFRQAGQLLLLGGGSHRTGKRGGGWEELRRTARRYWPQSREVAHWATQDCMTLDGAPYIGAYSPAEPNWYVATGFNKWGMTSSMAASLILCDLLIKGAADWGAVFDPARAMKPLPLAANVVSSTVGLLTPSLRRCPHLGCALKWNPREHTWDCPCHGSQFAANGRLLSSPAAKDWKGAPVDLPQKE